MNVAIVADLHMEDDDGLNVARIRDGQSLRVGDVTTAGTPEFWSWVLIERVEDGVVFFRRLTAGLASVLIHHSRCALGLTAPLVYVTGVRYVGGFVVELDFDTDETRVIDLEPLLTGGLFEQIHENPELFRRGYVDPDSGGLTWPNGAELAPAELYTHSRPMPATLAQGTAHRGGEQAVVGPEGLPVLAAPCTWIKVKHGVTSTSMACWDPDRDPVV